MTPTDAMDHTSSRTRVDAICQWATDNRPACKLPEVDAVLCCTTQGIHDLMSLSHRLSQRHIDRSTSRHLPHSSTTSYIQHMHRVIHELKNPQGKDGVLAQITARQKDCYTDFMTGQELHNLSMAATAFTEMYISDTINRHRSSSDELLCYLRSIDAALPEEIGPSTAPPYLAYMTSNDPDARIMAACLVYARAHRGLEHRVTPENLNTAFEEIWYLLETAVVSPHDIGSGIDDLCCAIDAVLAACGEQSISRLLSDELHINIQVYKIVADSLDELHSAIR